MIEYDPRSSAFKVNTLAQTGQPEHLYGLAPLDDICEALKNCGLTLYRYANL